MYRSSWVLGHMRMRELRRPDAPGVRELLRLGLAAWTQTTALCGTSPAGSIREGPGARTRAK
eukprot:7279271-Pyramimonas_sp.AAC.1